MRLRSGSLRKFRLGPDRVSHTHRRPHNAACISIFLAATLFACIPDTPQGDFEDPLVITVETTEELTAEWLTLAADPQTHAGNPRSFEIVDRLSKSGPEALLPLLNTIGDSNRNPHAKVFAVMCLADYITIDLAPRLRELTAAGLDGTTRACATTLLGRVNDSAVAEDLRTLAEDEERRVRFAAVLALAPRDDEFRQKLMAMYNEPETTDREKVEIIAMTIRDPRPEDASILSAAIVDPRTDFAVRSQAVATLGRIGNAESIDSIEQSVEIASDAAYTHIARAATAAIREREAQR